ncbi:MAG: NUDIX domain-containing protein [Egibacteraceae bacterium]
MVRTDYYDDPDAPRANSLIPGTSAVVVDDQGRILLHQRSDNAFWALPGGAMDIGERIGDTAIREVKGELSVSEESFQVRFFAPEDIERLDMHESIRLRIRHYLERRLQPFIG